jgi:putative hemolysin
VSYQGVNVKGQAIRGVSVARARVVRGMEHGCVVFMLWERAPLPLQGRMRACRWDQGLVGGWTAASVRPLLQLLPVRLWSYQLSYLSPRLTDP